MHRLIRNIHLILGLSCCLFLLMYSVSAVQMSHNDWFEMTPTVTEEDLRVASTAIDSPRALAAEMLRAHGLRGDVERANEEKGIYVVRITRPGTVAEVRYTPHAASAHVKTSKASFMGMLNRVHHVNGLWHENMLLNVWGVFVGLVSAALLGLGGTGVYMWFKIYDERLLGGLILSAGLVVGLGLLAAMRWQV